MSDEQGHHYETRHQSIRDAFVRRFGEPMAQAIEAAAREHTMPSMNMLGNDPFKWALLTAIGWECVNKFRDSHPELPVLATLDPEELATWCRHEADLGSFDGAWDGLSVLAGAYKRWL